MPASHAGCGAGLRTTAVSAYYSTFFRRSRVLFVSDREADAVRESMCIIICCLRCDQYILNKHALPMLRVNYTKPRIGRRKIVHALTPLTIHLILLRRINITSTTAVLVYQQSVRRSVRPPFFLCFSSPIFFLFLSFLSYSKLV